MATIQFKKGDEYLLKLSRLSRELKDKVIGAGIYEGAGIVADAVKAGIASLPTAAPNQWGTPENPLPGITEKQKAGLMDSFGVAPAQDDGTGYVHVKLGFDGYNDIKSKRWPQGQPNQLIARSAERGTSFMTATPFMKQSVASARSACIEAMKNTIGENIEEIMKG